MLRFIGFLVALSILFAAPANAAERITSFDSDVTVEADGAFLVKETITVVAEGVQIRRGIFRDFPTVFTLGDERERKVGFELISVMRDGRPENAKLEPAARFIRIRIGRADVMLSRGVHTYEITYRTTRQLRRFEDNDEVFWNATGNAWAFPIEKATATIRLPKGATVEDSVFYTGRSGARDKNARQNISNDNSVATFVTTKPLGPREGLTIGVKFTKGVVPAPTSIDKARWFIQDHLDALIAFLGLAAIFFYYLWAWTKVGRDPPKDTIVPRWDLPGDVSPALSHYIYNRGLKSQGFTAISAAALNLAVKGLVELDNQDGELTIRKTGTAFNGTLPVGEASLMSRLAGQGGSLTINEAHGKTVQAMAAKFTSAMKSEHRSTYYKANIGYILPGIVASVIFCFAALAMSPSAADVLPLLIPALVGGSILTVILGNLGRSLSSGGLSAKIQLIFVLFIGGAFLFNVGMGALANLMGSIGNMWLIGAIVTIAMVNVLFAFLMGAPTPIGQKRMAEIEGLRHYMSVAEEDRMNMLNAPDMSPKHYETLLPYAVALGCEKPWSRAFQGWLAAAVAAGAAGAAAYYGPSWYNGSGSFSPDTIGDTMGNIGSDMANSMTASLPAPESSSSGFSGGGGGGGFSGGGGGGGGGGGW